MKTFITIILIIFCNIAFSQRWENYQINGQGSSNCRITFVNADVGYILKAVDHPPSQSDFQLFKTTNAGINWTDNPISVFTTQVDYPCFKPAIHFFDENNGYLILLTPYDNNYSALWTYKTTNGGINWSSYQCYTTVENIASSYESLAKVKFINENTGYYLNTRCMYKTTNGGSTWDELLGPQIINGLYSAYEDFKISLLNTDNVYICGSAGGWPFAPVLFKIIGNSPQQIDPDPHTNPIFGLNSLDIIKNGNSEILKISGRDNILEYSNDHLYQIAYQNFQAADNLDIFFFSNPNKGILYVYNYDSYQNVILETTDGGYNWGNPEFESTPQDFSDFCRVGEIIYAVGLDQNIYPAKTNMYTRKMDGNFFAISDYYSSTSSTYWEFYDISYVPTLPAYNVMIRGGSQHVRAFQYPESQNTIFYRYGDGNMLPDAKYCIYKEGDTAFFKTRNISTTKEALSHLVSSTSPPTRVIRDTTMAGIPTFIHAIHESMGGIFYSRSTNNGVDFRQEELVSQILGIESSPIKELYDNKNSFLNIKYNGCHPLTIWDTARNVVAVWERYNNSNSKTEICISQRDVNANPESGCHWSRYSEPSPPYTNTFISFDAPQKFNSYPKIFVSTPPNNPVSWEAQYIYVPYLKPGTTGNDLILTASHMGNFQNFPIMTNVTDVAVTGQNNYFGFYLYFTFIKNNLIAYKKVSITFENNQFQLDTIDRKWDVSKGDGSGSVHAPDISLRNGKPVIAWQGSMYRTMTIVYEQGNDETMTYTNYPIVASYKYTTNTGENWSGFIKYPSSVNHTQQNANVEGCKNKLSFLINYSIDNSIFKQDVQFQNPSYSNYHCCPNYFSGTDAKLVKGSYFDDFGQNSNPMILTLSQQSPSQYLLSQQPFSITNLPCNYSNVDNYTNLGGIVNDSGINYYFNLGPIIVKNNYISGYDANGPIEITVLNSIDFNKNMISKPFLLSEGDTLILGGTGNYSPNPNEHFFLKKFNVSLFRQSNGQLQQLLFSDTLLYKDSVETEYLRGFFMSNFGSPDSFYVQMSIDSSDVSQGTAYKYSCAYSPDEIEGDNSGHYKSKIHFQNQNNNNISNIPKTFELQQNYPNPFNPSTTIKYNLPKDAYVTMKIYDIVGREIYTLVNENKQAGYYSVNFNGSNLASGIYFYRIKAGDFISVKKMLLIK